MQSPSVRRAIVVASSCMECERRLSGRRPCRYAAAIVASETEIEILRVFDALFAALLNQRDADAGTALFTDDADIVMWGSEDVERAMGRAAIAELHRGIAAFSGTLTFRWYERHVHVEGDAAWVNAAGELSLQVGGQAPRTGAYRLTAVLVRRHGSWRWHTFNGSEPNLS